MINLDLSFITYNRCVSCITQLGVACRCAEGALVLTVCDIDEDIKQYFSAYRSLRDTTCHQAPSGY